MTATTLSPLLAVLQMQRMKKLRLAYRENGTVDYATDSRAPGRNNAMYWST